MCAMSKDMFKKQLKYSKEDLTRLQALSLEDKVTLSKLRIQEWYEHWGGKVAVSFSGGKDSTVLLHLVREMYPEVPAVYVDTGMDLTSVKEFVRNTPNVVRVKPSMNFRQVIETYGWVFPSKNVAKYVSDARRGVRYATMMFEGKNSDGSPSIFNQDRYSRWKKLIDAPFKISEKCCLVMKEEPLDKYYKETGRKPYIGLLACESKRREEAWKKTGCNAFDSRKATSKPLSFWTEQDILAYIKREGLKISEAYGDIVEEKGKLKTTDEQRTGCIFCLIGAHLNKPNRIQRLKEIEPTKYKYCIEQLGMDEVMTWLNLPH